MQMHKIKNIMILLISISFLYSLPTLAKHKKHHHVTKHHHAVKHHHLSSNKPNKNESKTAALTTEVGVNPSPRVWTLALKAYNNALQKGYVKQKILTIIDYSLPSSVKRMWVVDVNTKKVLYHTLVTHGKYTGGLFAKYFSDRPGSQASSIGTFLTASPYFGSNGYSLRLRGLEPGFNDKAYARAIVFHGAWYATQDFARNHGRLGLSWGCPAVAPQLVKPIINQIKNGSLLFAYYPDSKWLHSSKFISDIG